MTASELHMDVRPYGDGRVVLTLGSLSLTLDAEARDKLRELLDRAAMPGQEGRRDDGEAAAAGVRVTQEELAAALTEFGLQVRPGTPGRQWVGPLHGTVAEPDEVARVLLVELEARRAHG